MNYFSTSFLRIEQIARAEVEFGRRVHVIALCAGNEELKQKTEAVKDRVTNPKVVVHVLGRKEGREVALPWPEEVLS